MVLLAMYAGLPQNKEISRIIGRCFVTYNALLALLDANVSSGQGSWLSYRTHERQDTLISLMSTRYRILPISGRERKNSDINT